MKQKIVVKAQIRCGKCRKKALKIAASADGVISVAIQGKEKDEIMIVGNSVDSAGLCNALRKKLGNADLISVEEVKDPKPEEKKPEEKKPEEKKTEKSEEKKPEKEEKKAEGDKKKEEEKKQKEDGTNKSESKASTSEASSIYHHYHPNYPPTNYCCPNYPPPQCHLYATYYDDPNPNCTIM